MSDDTAQDDTAQDDTAQDGTAQQVQQQYDADARVIAPVIVSTRAATGEREDLSAPIIEEFAHEIGFMCRPPVIIPDGEGVLAALSELLVPAPASLIELHAVSTAVNNVRNKAPQLIDEVDSEVPLDR